MSALIALLMALAAPASEPATVPSENPARDVPGARAEDTVGFDTFERHCLDAKRWKDTPDLARVEGELSSQERQAFNLPGGDFRVFLASAEPRVLLGLQWQEMQANQVSVRGGRVDETRRPVTLVGGRCIVFAHEDVWQGMPEAFERVTGAKPQDISSPDRGFDGLMTIDTAAASRSSGVPRAHTFGASRLDGTTMYRAIM